MDLYCRFCREPWDNDCFHDEAEATGKTYGEVAADFRRRGCAALTSYDQTDCRTPEQKAGKTSDFTALADVVYDLMGDDMDGAASTFEDAEFMGLM